MASDVAVLLVCVMVLTALLIVGDVIAGQLWR